MMMKKNKNQEFACMESVTILSASAMIKGEIHIEDDFRVDGTIEGNIHGKGRVIIGPVGCVKGNIQSRNIELSGKIYGDVNASELVLLRADSYYKGEIITKHLEVEAGAVFLGNCNMTNAEESNDKAILKLTLGHENELVPKALVQNN